MAHCISSVHSFGIQYNDQSFEVCTQDLPHSWGCHLPPTSMGRGSNYPRGISKVSWASSAAAPAVVAALFILMTFAGMITRSVIMTFSSTILMSPRHVGRTALRIIPGLRCHWPPLKFSSRSLISKRGSCSIVLIFFHKIPKTTHRVSTFPTFLPSQKYTIIKFLDKLIESISLNRSS